MTLEQASEIIGGQAKVFVLNMRRALSLMPKLNTDAENERYKAAGIVLRNWKKHIALMQEKRNRK